MKYTIQSASKKLLADTLTPVNIYLKLRDVYAGSILLESSDYHGHENSLSMICCDPLASFKVVDSTIEFRYPDQTIKKVLIKSREEVLIEFDLFRTSFDTDADCGLFGYMTYDTVRYFEDIVINLSHTPIPDMYYSLYRYVIVVDHFTNQLTLTEHSPPGEEKGLTRIEQLMFSNRFSTYPFYAEDHEQVQVSDQEFLTMVRKGIEHCNRGDVFQLVLSRRFSCGFKGDEFNVYRALRSINPSPYLFYFDFGSFKLFGSSPEAQLQIKNGIATIYPIAGTFRRTGNDAEDARLAEELAADEKENAEHIMLVDLARNDMSRNAEKVTVEVFKEIQFYSHVIHLVSKVTGKLSSNASIMRMARDTFPAGTLSGAPKYKAMTLISKYEKSNRGFYGGTIGFVELKGDFNHAIMIRTFLSMNNTLTYQAGAGIVAKSNPENELREVTNKLAALRSAIRIAQTL